MTRPLLLLDVDGVLNPDFRGEHKRRKPPYCGHAACRDWRRVNIDALGLRVYLNPVHGGRLRSLAEQTGAELAWATTWQDYANQWIGPYLHLPKLKVAPCPNRPDGYPGGRGEWKASHVVPWTAGIPFVGIPFVWLEDEPGAAEYAAEHATGPHLVIGVNPDWGLTDNDLAQAREWLEAL